ncbi:hypothetical protein K402DRAFT_467921 [Aulographum hederae CBS 113979]|uniref:Uncharacterized protein n=1 Tax=Aulographum hederae CBS 113979 TaxID=1176131 RepID=A0A6G1GJG9_9PEZI|nr:hypothetical protein K402DRAFT_467921 [Aulographum hederae CBS 113979]
MSSIIARSAFRASRPLYASRTLPLRATGVNAGEAAASDREAGKQAMKTGAKRDPELMVLFAVMASAFAFAGYHFANNPTSSSSEKSVSKIHGSEPWNSGGEGKYQYHPHGDTTKEKKDAPSALNVTIIPDVNLPKELHDAFNKYGKPGY